MAKRKRFYENPVGREEVGEHRDALADGLKKGRGAGLNPGNRFENVRLHVLGEHLDDVAREQGDSTHIDIGAHGQPRLISDGQAQTQVFPDRTRTIINKVQFPDMGFDWTLNPYRGCAHGCIYCYARPYHEYLGFSSGIDFETKILAKFEAPTLLEHELASPRWTAQEIVMSAITDCWQPIEDELRISRACMEVLARCRQPVTLMTRSRRVLRDLDLIQELVRYQAVQVTVTITTLDNKLASVMEPRASSPADRLAAMRALSAAGVPVIANIAPLIPGLTDTHLPALLEAIADAGAHTANLCMIRLPYQNKDLFIDWLNRQFPDRAKHVETLIRDVFGGKLYDSSTMTRMKGTHESPIAKQISQMFQVFSTKYGLNRPLPPLSNAAFRPPARNGQLALF